MLKRRDQNKYTPEIERSILRRATETAPNIPGVVLTYQRSSSRRATKTASNIPDVVLIYQLHPLVQVPPGKRFIGLPHCNNNLLAIVELYCTSDFYTAEQRLHALHKFIQLVRASYDVCGMVTRSFYDDNSVLPQFIQSLEAEMKKYPKDRPFRELDEELENPPPGSPFREAVYDLVHLLVPDQTIFNWIKETYKPRCLLVCEQRSLWAAAVDESRRLSPSTFQLQSELGVFVKPRSDLHSVDERRLRRFINEIRCRNIRLYLSPRREINYQIISVPASFFQYINTRAGLHPEAINYTSALSVAFNRLRFDIFNEDIYGPAGMLLFYGIVNRLVPVDRVINYKDRPAISADIKNEKKFDNLRALVSTCLFQQFPIFKDDKVLLDACACRIYLIYVSEESEQPQQLILSVINSICLLYPPAVLDRHSEPRRVDDTLYRNVIQVCERFPLQDHGTFESSREGLYAATIKSLFDDIAKGQHRSCVGVIALMAIMLVEDTSASGRFREELIKTGVELEALESIAKIFFNFEIGRHDEYTKLQDLVKKIAEYIQNNFQQSEADRSTVQLVKSEIQGRVTDFCKQLRDFPSSLLGEAAETRAEGKSEASGPALK